MSITQLIDNKKSKNFTSGGKKISPLEVENFDCNNNNKINNNNIIKESKKENNTKNDVEDSNPKKETKKPKERKF